MKKTIKPKEMDAFGGRVADAYHEAGHAAVSFFYKHSVTRIHIKHFKDIGGGIGGLLRGVDFNNARPNISIRNLEYIQQSMGGSAAVRLKFGDSLQEYGGGDDEKSSMRFLSAMTLDRKWKGFEGLALREWLMRRTEVIVRIVWPAVVAIANELLKKEEISGARAKELYDAVKIKGFRKRLKYKRNKDFDDIYK